MDKRRKDVIGGLILLGIGGLALLGQFVNLEQANLGLFFMPALGALFLIWGILTREAGLMIPGGIISGIGWGAAAIAGPVSFVGNSDNEGGLFLIIFGLGFASITLLTAVFTSETHWWALIPGGILAVIGAGVLFGGVFLEILTVVGRLWPVALIALGIYVIMQASRQSGSGEKLPK